MTYFEKINDKIETTNGRNSQKMKQKNMLFKFKWTNIFLFVNKMKLTKVNNQKFSVVIGNCENVCR